ncbi:MAG: EutN/CcmL family microcompartment protein [Candidatus Latescibacteria bacterium]|jgi:ethanolamine utilization protein EutN|nr:ethanolamine utilization protein EutN [Gemmatimonadota bacterium]MCH2659656.1 EutN/CcmL family microcompartment protein [bacterium]MDP6701473.1 EutN/CcmL family microcompartment protein [Candidatus Latescibacterota bacterium]|tara:strand:- start:2126 stop:2425 length:300 start_codon:yes stop_codon:yes gene_type:complete
MLLGQVKGHVVSTAKVESLNGKKLMLVEVVSVREHGLVTTGREMVCIDAVQAGVGELVIVVQGSSARIAPEFGKVPTDAVIIGIVDTLQAMGVDMELQA